MDARRASARRLGGLERGLVAANRGVVVVLMAVMAVLVFVNVVSRYAFNYSLIWVEELTQYQMIWITYLGAGLAMREGRHVAVEIAQDRLPGPLRRYTRVVIWVLMFVFLAALTILGFGMAAFTWDQETPVMNMPTGLPYLAIPIGALVFGLHFVLCAQDFVDKRFEHSDELDAHAE